MTSDKKRGPYQKTKDKMVTSQPKNFFKEDHEKSGLLITWADAVDRGNGSISILYKVQNDKKQHRCPRWKTVWLDGKGLDYAKLVVSNWKNGNNNSLGKGSLFPDFYIQHRKDFLKWLHNSAGHTTIEGYENALKQYVFPYLVGRLELTSPKKWNLEAIAKWEAFLCDQELTVNSRNRKRTAFRRYLKFLKRRNIIKVVPQIFDETVKRTSIETPIPGELPEWTDVVKWLKGLPAGRYRFVRTIGMAFGLRISEAMAIEYEDFIGAGAEEFQTKRNDFISKIIDKELGALFLNVNRANKRIVSKELINLIGEDQDTTPKSGQYTACCTNTDIAEFILEMIENDEHNMELSKDEVYRIKDKMPVDTSPYKFHQYCPHDDRRLNITLQCLDLSMDISDVIEICCLLHGQSSRDVFNRYFQWGQMQRRKKNIAKGEKLKLFKTKSS
jgi:integrase